MEKTCSCCKVAKPESDFFRRKDSKDGFSWQCKACFLEKRELYNKKREQEALKQRDGRTMTKCPQCGGDVVQFPGQGKIYCNKTCFNSFRRRGKINPQNKIKTERGGLLASLSDHPRMRPEDFSPAGSWEREHLKHAGEKGL